ncbi:hypothetical protein B0O99DRAFT_623518 [Bisporella sp. PMI_857]|nr:hypothetical protein B0O99DRAFT_623518 [Bisporella sp. PMI_857]
MHLRQGPTQQNINIIDNMLYLPLPYQMDQQGSQDIPDTFSMQLPYVPPLLTTNDTTSSLPGPQVFTQYSVNPPTPGRSMFQCSNCMATFTRDADRIRHENTKHRMVPGTHVCPITPCPKSQGVGYSRPDKLKEHLWKQHANLGYTKRT